jgi:hypothetical protein
LSAHNDVFAEASADAEASLKSFSAAFLGLGEIRSLRQAIGVGSGRRLAAAEIFSAATLRNQVFFFRLSTGMALSPRAAASVDPFPSW